MERGGEKDDPGMPRVPGRLQQRRRQQVPRMFVFLWHPGAGPANNAGKRVLRYMVLFRKIIGQTGGGPGAMRRWLVLPRASSRGEDTAKACTKRPSD